MNVLRFFFGTFFLFLERNLPSIRLLLQVLLRRAQSGLSVTIRAKFFLKKLQFRLNLQLKSA